MKAAAVTAAAAAILLWSAAAPALTLLPPLSAMLPAQVPPGGAFPDGEASGWRFADLGFFDAPPRDAAPDLPTLAGLDDPAADGLLAVGGGEVLATPARPLTRAQAIREAALPLQDYDPVALGAFDAASGQSLADHSLTIGGVTAGRDYTFRFAGQVGADEND